MGLTILYLKSTPVQSMNDFITEYAESLYTSSKKDIIVTDNEHVIAVQVHLKKI